MSDPTPNLELSTVPSNTLQPSVPVNDSLQALDALVQLAVETTLSAPPATVEADAGKRWIIGAGATGEWAGKSGQIALCTAAGLWRYFEPKEGWRAAAKDTDTDFRFNGAAWVAIAENILPRGYIDGLTMEWVSGTSLRVTSGTAYIESVGALVNVPSAITKAGLTLSASTWYHVYLFLNAGVPDIEVVTTAPATTYSGTARSKTGDASRRYVGSVLADGSGNIYRFTHGLGKVIYLLPHSDGSAPFRALAAGQATVATTINLATTVPVTSRAVQLKFTNTDAGFAARFLNSDSGLSPPQAILSVPPGTGESAFVDAFPIAAQTMQYFMNGGSSGVGVGAYVDVIGYLYER